MQVLRTLVGVFMLSLIRSLTFRTNLVAQLIINLIGVGSSLLVVQAIFHQTRAISGWDQASVLILLGTWYMATGLLWAIVESNASLVREHVLSGDLDDNLLKPIPSLILNGLGIQFYPMSLIQVPFGLGVIGIGLRLAGELPSVMQVGAWFVMFTVGMIWAWAARMMLSCLAFWAPSLQLGVFYMAIWEFGRYPASMFRQPMQAVLTWVLPAGVVATVAVDALTSEANPLLLLLAPPLAGVAVMATNLVWNAGLRRYTSATS